MHFELYSPKTIKQINTELTARMAEKGTRSRPAIQGVVEKTGAIYWSTQTVLLGITRTTRLRATLEKAKDVTIIRGYVSEGVRPEKVYVVMGALAAIGLLLALQGQVVLGLIVFGVSVVAYVPLVGDFRNSRYMLKELKRLTNAKDKPPPSLLAAQNKPAARTRSSQPNPPRTSGSSPAPTNRSHSSNRQSR
jgi:hypothetical protein